MSESKGRIVVGVDGSEASLDALKWASAQAKLTGGSLVAVISWVIPASYGVAFGGEDAIDWKENASRALDEALTAALGDEASQVERRIEQGHPSYVLVEESKNADLVVVGSRGHGGFAGLVLGSVSSYVVSHSECPVTVTRHHGDAS
ncbi:universal stress protein [Epidermidibacterium keratini]|uniref:Universal stress protein n=1 Tax=Epidermidibacterium keratini TaxID=1891644 RepID=A0A7L4YLX5_9ACTN|nr:universal stress protein [Epidermidibacterium keratini]QHC00285.1 universal stress protein [Epidermidibacterium keratini]